MMDRSQLLRLPLLCSGLIVLSAVLGLFETSLFERTGLVIILGLFLLGSVLWIVGFLMLVRAQSRGSTVEVPDMFWPRHDGDPRRRAMVLSLTALYVVGLVASLWEAFAVLAVMPGVGLAALWNSVAADTGVVQEERG
ncbi:MAG: hypothetical protein KAZ88_01170 [Acidimicrobiia bacterium]|jgi:hypothetical protein|nr:hypothetical protein [Acidimicrobiia bacterium]MBP8179586.1 hypothetical protein [Acidimicrobiia bacterium]